MLSHLDSFLLTTRSSTPFSEQPENPKLSAMRWRFWHPEHRIITTPLSDGVLKVSATFSWQMVQLNSMYLVGDICKISSATGDSIVMMFSSMSSCMGYSGEAVWVIVEVPCLFWKVVLGDAWKVILEEKFVLDGEYKQHERVGCDATGREKERMKALAMDLCI